MNPAPAKQLDLTAPPVVNKIYQRSLIVGVVFAIASIILAIAHPDQFYRGYLLGFLCWLGVSLGSMAIVMIRHLTGGGWGMVIRRILGAAMRTLPLLAILFIPIIIAVVQHRIYPWAMPTESVQDPYIREHLEKHSFIKDAYLNQTGFIIRAIIYFVIWNVLSFLLSMWSRQTDRPGAPDNTQKFKAVAGPGLILALFHFVVPFAVLLSRPFKRNIRKLVWLAIWLMLMRWVDLFWIIEPNFMKGLGITIADVVVPIAIGGFWLAYFFRNLGSLPLLPAYDPSAGEVLETDPNHPRGIPENA